MALRMQPATVHIEEIREYLISIIRRECGAVRIILFGSYARGTQKEHSDLDLLVVVRKEFLQNRSRMKEETNLSRALNRFHVPKDILIYTDEEYQFYQNSTNHVVRRASDEGTLLYAS